MAVSIRLRREGAKNRPYYKVVVADSRSPRDGKFIELIGTYDPKKPDHNSTLKLDRIELYQLHAPDPKVPLEEGVRRAIEYYREFGVSQTYTHLKLGE